MACHCKNPSNDSHSSEHGSGEEGNSTSGGSVSSNITADMLNSLAGDGQSELIKQRLEKYLAPGSKIDVDEQGQEDRTILYDLMDYMNQSQIHLKSSNKITNAKRQQAIIDIATELLNRGARPDMPDIYNHTPLLEMVDHCVGLYTYNSVHGGIDRTKEMALLQKMVQAPGLTRTHLKSRLSNNSAYDYAQVAGDREVLALLTGAGINQ
jgi:hypothetical protein